jgi:hypothetical protein
VTRVVIIVIAVAGIRSCEARQQAIDGFACFSPVRRYRWSLHRAWACAGPSMAFVLLNPGMAGARDDATTGITADGHLAHPLRLHRNAPVRPWTLAAPIAPVVSPGVCESPGSREAGAPW